MLDADSCYRAIETKDARFDGQFFTGVRTTGIYCRPVCPARAPKRENCNFYPSSAAAQEAGFRPCLRCRPEVSPGLPAWIGTSATVTRALRLIDNGALDDNSVEDLAAKLGVGDRHLRRLFLDHLGATPVAVALNRRILFAKKLLTETTLPVSDIAFAAGFGSIRRFNDAMQQVYARSPRDLRKRTLVESAEGPITLRLGYRPPYRWDQILNFLGHRAIPGLEEVTGDTYIRHSANSRITIRNLPEHHAIEARIEGLDTVANLRTIVEKIRQVFDLRANALEIARHLEHADPSLNFTPGTRVPGCWDAFELATRAVLGQQITVTGARTLAHRITQKYGNRFPTPAEAQRENYNGIGLTSKRIETLQALAKAFANLDLTQGLDHIETALTAVPGIGPWTAHYIAMRAANEPDAFPASDLALRKAAGNITQKQLEAKAEAWRPWRAYAALHLWSTL
ncbi:AraC family transcriptional regulator [Bryobacterales bacterium F-183]|nr:AraC family transcriptional regulator [Bryobacterales bacterium F-183]